MMGIESLLSDLNDEFVKAKQRRHRSPWKQFVKTSIDVMKETDRKSYHFETIENNVERMEEILGEVEPNKTLEEQEELEQLAEGVIDSTARILENQVR